VLGSDEKEAIRRLHRILEAHHGGSWIRLIVLVEEREVVDPQDLQFELALGKPGERPSEFSVDRILADAADDDRDLVHDAPLPEMDRQPVRSVSYLALPAANGNRRPSTDRPALLPD
jgi:hypothetical protein